MKLEMQLYLQKCVMRSNFVVYLILILATSCLTKEEKTYYENGQIKSITQVENNLKNGYSLVYYEDGSLMYEYFYENGLKQDLAKLYYKDGVLKQIAIFKNDTIVESASYRKDGTLELVKEYDEFGQLIEYTCYLDSGRHDSDPSKRYPLVVSSTDSIKQGEIYRAEVRLGNRLYNSIYVFLGDTTDVDFYLKPHLERVYKEVSILEIDTDTCTIGENIVYGNIFETCDTCQGFGWTTPFEHTFYVLPNTHLGVE